MPDGKVLIVALAIGAAVYGGAKVVTATRDHVVKPAYSHVIKPVGCGVKKLATLGHAGCAKK